jgi:hypothetical protein
LHVTGLPAAQAWLAKAVAAALEIEVFAPKTGGFCAQCGLKGDAPAGALGLLFQAAPGEAWRQSWLDASMPALASAPAPKQVKMATQAPVKTPAPVPASVAAGSAPAPAPAPAAPKPRVASPTPAPVAHVAHVAKSKPVQKPVAPAPVIIREAAPEPAVLPALRYAAPSTQKPTVLIGALVSAVVVLGGATAFFAAKNGGNERGAVAAPVFSTEEIRVREMEQARMLAEELKNPRSFRNERYSFEVSDRGFLRKLVGVGNRTLIDEFGWLELQGTISGTSTPFTAGTITDQAYVSSINKTVRDGKVVFEIKGVHPRFTMDTLVTCLPTTLLIETTFKPFNMVEARGLLSGTYMVKMNRQSLALGQRAVSEPGKVSYTTQSGQVVLKFNGDTWGPAGEAGKQAVIVASNLVFFDFAGNGPPAGTVLKAELTLP